MNSRGGGGQGKHAKHTPLRFPTLELGLQAAASLVSLLCVYIVSMAFLMPIFGYRRSSWDCPPAKDYVTELCGNEIHSPLVGTPFGTAVLGERFQISQEQYSRWDNKRRNNAARVGFCSYM